MSRRSRGPSRRHRRPLKPARLSVIDEQGTAHELSADDLAPLRKGVKVTDGAGSRSSTKGYELAEVLKHCGVMLGEVAAPDVASYVLLEAEDGYRVVLAIAEVDPATTDKMVLLADRRDGKVLPEKERPFRLVIPDEKRQVRWIRMSNGSASNVPPASQALALAGGVDADSPQESRAGAAPRRICRKHGQMPRGQPRGSMPAMVDGIRPPGQRSCVRRWPATRSNPRISWRCHSFDQAAMSPCRLPTFVSLAGRHPATTGGFDQQIGDAEELLQWSLPQVQVLHVFVRDRGPWMIQMPRRMRQAAV